MGNLLNKEEEKVADPAVAAAAGAEAGADGENKAEKFTNVNQYAHLCHLMGLGEFSLFFFGCILKWRAFGGFACREFRYWVTQDNEEKVRELHAKGGMPCDILFISPRTLLYALPVHSSYGLCYARCRGRYAAADVNAADNGTVLTEEEKKAFDKANKGKVIDPLMQVHEKISGDYPMHLAAERNSVKMIELLFFLQAKVDSANRYVPPSRCPVGICLFHGIVSAYVLGWDPHRFIAQYRAVTSQRPRSSSSEAPTRKQPIRWVCTSGGAVALVVSFRTYPS